MNVLLHDEANKNLYIAIIKVCQADGQCTGAGSKKILVDMST